MFDIGRQNTARIDAWRKELPRHVFHPCGAVGWQWAEAPGRLTAEEAMALPLRPAVEGMAWGAPWSYAWFRGRVTVPEGHTGRLVMYPCMGGEMLVWVDGALRCSIDRQHPYVTLGRDVKPGESFNVLIEAYAGHGTPQENGGPCPPERAPLPPIPEKQQVVKPSPFGIWDEDAYGLMMDMETLWSLLEVLPERSLRAMKVAEALVECTNVADFELEAGERVESFRAARDVLRPALQCVNGSTAPVMTIFGQSHLDLAWKWTWEETRRKCARTYANQLALMEEWPEYIFYLCEPPILEAVRTEYPALWQRVEARIKEGRMIPEGGFWVECDTNLPGGEAMVRQLVWGKRWYREVCGVDVKMGWIPDTFGFSAVLPQLFRGCGIEYFSTQKLLRADPETEPFPYNDFIWEGMDGSEVYTHMLFKNNSQIKPALLEERWTVRRNQNHDMDGMIYPFGYGDGGGGADRDMLEYVARLKDLEGVPRTEMRSPIAYFEEMKGRKTLDRWVGELYLAWHRGTYSAQLETKRSYRQAEFSLREAEIWAALAAVKGVPVPGGQLHDMWERVLFNSFHDVLSGVGIAEVHAKAVEELEDVKRQSAQLAVGSGRALSEAAEGEGCSLFNSLSFAREGWVRLPEGYAAPGWYDEAGAALPVIRRDSANYVYAVLPPMGWATVTPGPAATEQPPLVSCVALPGGGYRLENGYLRAELDGAGRVVSLVQDGMEMMRGAGNVLHLYKDINPNYDAWELAKDYVKREVALEETVSFEVEVQNGYEVVLRLTRRFSKSVLEQRITLRAFARRLDLECRLDWQERHKILKVGFETDILCDDAVHEIQFGHISRPAHDSNQFAQDRYEVYNHKWTALCEEGRGVALLNDGLYGISTGRGSMALTLARAPLAPDGKADIGLHEFTYSLMPFTGRLADSGVIEEGYVLNTQPTCVAGNGGSGSLLRLDAKGVLIEAVKPAEDGSGDVVVRLYEAGRRTVKARLDIGFPVKAVWQTDMLEEAGDALELAQGGVMLYFRPFEVKTLRLKVN